MEVAIVGEYLVLSPNRLTYHLSLIYTWTSVQRSAKQFYGRNRFIEFYVVHWLIVHYKRLCCTLLKEDSPVRATLIFIKEKSELQWFVLDCEMSFLNKTSFNFPANIYSVLIPGKLNDLFLCFSVWISCWITTQYLGCPECWVLTNGYKML